jgi:glycogen synthase
LKLIGTIGAMNILMLTNEYPPHIYGGAGVHVDHLCREIAQIDGGAHRLRVFCFGDQNEHTGNLSVTGVGGGKAVAVKSAGLTKLLDTLERNIVMAGLAEDADIIHCHTWYSYLAGCLLKQLLQIPLLVTLHSLEPHRPWKKEQLGNGYHVSAWLEKTALSNADGIIAVSGAMKDDVRDLYGVDGGRVQVVYNGIDLHTFQRTLDPGVLAAYGIASERPYVLFVGRITRQKGIIHLVRALPQIDEGVQIVLCAGAPDTEQIATEMQAAVETARAGMRNSVIWIREIVPLERLVVLYSHAVLFICPSVYEPFGIINLEAMACRTPVVATAVGGIREAVADGQTGVLVPFEPCGQGNPEPRDPERFAGDLASAVNGLLCSPERRAAMGRAARARVERHFSWKAIAGRTVEYYQGLCRR